MNKEKVERNKLILKCIEEGKTYTEIMAIFSLKSKGNIYQIVKRDKDRKAVLSLSTGKDRQRT